MKLVYTHQNSIVVGLVQSALESKGISVELRNEMLSGAAGELAPIDLWPQLWVETERQYERVQPIINQFNQQQSQSTWHCNSCNEDNEATFEVCWRCQSIPQPS